MEPLNDAFKHIVDLQQCALTNNTRYEALNQRIKDLETNLINNNRMEPLNDVIDLQQSAFTNNTHYEALDQRIKDLETKAANQSKQINLLTLSVLVTGAVLGLMYVTHFRK